VNNHSGAVMPADDPSLGIQHGERVVARFFDDFTQELGRFFKFIALENDFNRCLGG
jgi:hypothetical protein